jgi:hypothetical protein
MPWILGCGGCGLLIVIGIVAAIAFGAYAKRHRGQGGTGGDTTAVAAQDTAGTTLFTSSEDGLNETLRPHYLPFSFRYPSGWEVKERGSEPGDLNFVKVEKEQDGITAENFAVGYMSAPEGHESDPALMQQLLSQLQQQFSQQFPGFQRTSDDQLTLDGHRGSGFRFTAKMNDIDVYGRTDVIPVGNGRGLTIIMLGTPRNSGLGSVDDLGEKGGIPTIIRTFRIGEPGEAASSGQDTSTEPSSATGTDESKPEEGTPATNEQPSDQQQQPQGADSLPQIRRIQPLNP